MKRIILSIFTLALLFLLAVCGIGENGNFDDGGGYDSGHGGGYSSTGSSDGDSLEPGEDESGIDNRPAPGQLTSGEWSDIKNYGFYLNLFKIANDPDADESQQRSGFSQFINYFGFETRFMVTVNVACNENPVNDAAVALYDQDQSLLFTAKTDMRGNAYLFPYYSLKGETVTVKATSGNFETVKSFAYGHEELKIELEESENKQPILDLMFVIDTTGSMSDELNYLKTEISDVIGKISADNPNYAINLALLFYRDNGDDYVTRYFDFSTNIAQQRSNLAKQSANGGGDFPEAVDKALSEAVAKNWTDGNATRLIFHVCDAPPHDKQPDQTLFFNSVKAAAAKGIRIIPVASSGVDLPTEFLLRQEALMTGGTYIFLTDDSGIGNSHLQPTIGDYTVEYLNACLVRVVNEYLTGIETEPVPYYN
jgi:hypothetical protein